MDIQERFEKASDAYYDKGAPTSSRPTDMEVFVFLAAKFPNYREMIASAAHDQIWLLGNCPSDDELNTLTDEEIAWLVQAGVFFDCESLSMFA